MYNRSVYDATYFLTRRTYFKTLFKRLELFGFLDQDDKGALSSVLMYCLLYAFGRLFERVNDMLLDEETNWILFVFRRM